MTINDKGNSYHLSEKVKAGLIREPEGYWIKGQALEADGLGAEALKMYNTALEKARAKKDPQHYELPLPIIIKIRELEEKLSSPMKK